MVLCALALSCVYADAPSNIIIQPSANDISLKFFNIIFPLNGVGGSSMFSTLMIILNVGLSSIVAGIVAYTIMYAAIGAAAESMMVGQKIHLWNVVRICIGTYFMIPTYAGFSSLQAIILWCVINGVGLADVLWNNIIVTMYDGPSPGGQTFSADLASVIGIGSTNQQTTQIAAMASAQLCLQYYYYAAINSDNPEWKSAVIKKPYSVKTSYNVNDENYAIDNNGCGNNFTGICYGGVDPLSSTYDYNPSLCGSFSLNTSGFSTSSEILTGINSLQQASNIVAAGVNIDFANYYNQYYAAVSSQSTLPTGYSPCDPYVSPSAASNCGIASSIVEAAANYLQSIETVRYNPPDLSSNATIQQAQSQGWASAGYFYTQILGAQGNILPTLSGSLQSINNYTIGTQKISNVNPPQTVPQTAPKINIQNYVYNYFYNQINNSGSSTMRNASQLQTNLNSMQNTIAMSSAPVSNPCLAAPQGGASQNMICDPTVNKATFNMISLLFGNPNPLESMGTQVGVLAPWLSGQPYLSGGWTGLTQVLIMAGGGSGSNINIAEISLINTGLCVIQAMTGIQIFMGNCQYNTIVNVNNYACTSLDASCFNNNSCLYNAVNSGCISSSLPGMGMLGSFYYNQTHPVGINPLLTVINVGQQIMNASAQSIQYIVENTLNNYVAAGLGLLVFNSATDIAATIAGDGMYELDQPQAAYISATLIDVVKQTFIFTYKLIEFEIGYMFSAYVTINAMLLGFGAIYAVYLPAVPMIIYTMGVICWFAIVIEAMVAAPLIAAGITYPEGGKFLGLAEQGMQLFLSVILRPPLMVIGLYMATLSAQIGIDLLHYGIMNFIVYMYSGLTGGSLASVIMFAMICMVYVYLAFEILSYCYTFISILPDNVMKWFIEGSGNTNSGGVINQITVIKDQAQSVGEQVGRATPRTSSAGVEGFGRVGTAAVRAAKLAIGVSQQLPKKKAEGEKKPASVEDENPVSDRAEEADE